MTNMVPDQNILSAISQTLADANARPEPTTPAPSSSATVVTAALMHRGRLRAVADA
jgi:hypothetical protein